MEDFVIEVSEKHWKTLDISAPKDLIDSFLLPMDEARTAGLGWVLGNRVMDTLLTLN